MKKRTNLLALVLSITAIIFTLFGCSSDTGQKKSIAAPGSATETGGGAESSGTNGGGADQASADESINEQVLVDQDGIKITATEYVTDSIWGDGIKLLVENNSARDYTIGCDALIVNDYMITDLFSADVAAGKKSIVTDPYKPFGKHMHQKHPQKVYSLDCMWDISSTIPVIFYKVSNCLICHSKDPLIDVHKSL